MKYLLLGTSVLGLTLTAPAAQAQSVSDRAGTAYISGSFGLNTVDDTDFNFTTGTDVENDYDAGYVFGIEGGYNLGPVYFIDNVKLGLEFGYTANEIDSHSIGGIGQPGSTGDLYAYTFMANMYHEYDTGTRFVPYYGLGIGFASVEADGFGITGAQNALDDDGTAFMYQGTLGVNYILNQNIDLGLRYRYSATAGLDFRGGGAGAQDRDFDYESHNFTANVTYNF